MEIVLNVPEDFQPRFKDEQLHEILDWFEQNKVSLKVTDEISIDAITLMKFKKFIDLKKFHRRQFHYPTYDELMTAVESLKIQKYMSRPQFLCLLDKWVQIAEIKHELILAFKEKLFDTEKRDFLDIEEFKNIFINHGDIFNNEELIELLRDADVRGDGNIVYENFVESLFSLAPELYDIKAEYLYDDPDEDPSVPPEPVIEEEPPPPPLPPPPSKKDKKKNK